MIVVDSKGVAIVLSKEASAWQARLRSSDPADRRLRVRLAKEGLCIMGNCTPDYLEETIVILDELGPLYPIGDDADRDGVVLAIATYGLMHLRAMEATH